MFSVCLFTEGGGALPQTWDWTWQQIGTPIPPDLALDTEQVPPPDLGLEYHPLPPHPPNLPHATWD